MLPYSFCMLIMASLAFAARLIAAGIGITFVKDIKNDHRD